MNEQSVKYLSLGSGSSQTVLKRTKTQGFNVTVSVCTVQTTDYRQEFPNRIIWFS